MNMKTEAQILEETQAAIAAGKNPFDDEDDVGTVASDASDTTSDSTTDETGDAAQTDQANGSESSTEEAGDKPAASADEVSAQELEAIANGDDATSQTKADPLQILNFEAQLPSDYSQERTKLYEQKAENMKKLLDGEIDATQHAAEDMRISGAIEDLTALRIRAETLQEVNSQSAATYQKNVISSLIERTKSEVPYLTDPTAPKQFDIALAGLKADPDNAALSYDALAAKAHDVVKALRGVQTSNKAQSGTKTQEQLAQEASARKPNAAVPPTLRGVPAASTPNTGGSVIDRLAQLSGVEYEAAYSKLTPAQRAELLD